MKKYFLLLFLALVTLLNFVEAQSFKDGLHAYDQKNYETAIQIFSSLSDEQSQLFLGKSLFLINRFDEARFVLAKLSKVDSPSLKGDALFTLAQLYISENNFAKAMDCLYEIGQLSRGVGKVQGEAKIQFNRLNTFLSFQDRVDIIRNTNHPQVIFPVIEEGLRTELKKDAAVLLSIAEKLAHQNVIKSNELEQLRITYKRNAVTVKRLDTAPPDGYNFTLGVVLPSNKLSETIGISQHLYQGIRTAVEIYNQQENSNKVFLSYRSDSDSLNPVADLVINESADMIIGPLTSQSAKEMIGYAELFQIPVIAPLANNDSLNNDNPFFFQINPTFGMIGKRMAQFAIEELQVQTVAVLADKSTLGYQSALAFKEEMEKNGVDVAYFKSDDFKKTGFNMSDYTAVFTSDQLLKDSLQIPDFDAIYLPFTGEYAQTMIDLTLTDLEAQSFFAPILGSQDWGYVELPAERLQKFTMYFPDSKEINETDEQVIQFRQLFTDFTKSEPDYFSYLGYDIGKYLISVIESTKKPGEFKTGIKQQKTFYGLSTEIQFNGGHVNEIIYIYESDKDGITKVYR